jgi:nucleotide-binding universal stress UspA family protein
MCRWGGFQGGQAVIDEDGKVEAYLVSRVSRGALEVAEAAVASPGLTPAVLAAAGRAAEARGLPRVEFSTPPGHPVARYLRQFASRHEARVDPRRNAALAIVDARETFEIMIPDWEARLAHTALGLGRCEVTLQVGPSSYRVRAHHGAVDISEVSGAAKLALDPAQFAQALAGYRPIADIAGPAFNALPEEAQDLLETLFVERFPHVWVLDASGPEAAGMGEDTGRDGD